ncbi:hypothetical protein KEM54_002657, partial [Ascosphaera aggregata]
ASLKEVRIRETASLTEGIPSLRLSDNEKASVAMVVASAIMGEGWAMRGEESKSFSPSRCGLSVCNMASTNAATVSLPMESVPTAFSNFATNAFLLEQSAASARIIFTLHCVMASPTEVGVEGSTETTPAYSVRKARNSLSRFVAIFEDEDGTREESEIDNEEDAWTGSFPVVSKRRAEAESTRLVFDEVNEKKERLTCPFTGKKPLTT